MQSIRILFVSTSCDRQMRFRSWEIAIRLAQKFDLYYQWYNDPRNYRGTNYLFSKLYSVWCFFSNIFRKTGIEESNIKLAIFPFLLYTPWHRLINRKILAQIIPSINTFFMKRFCRRFQIDLIFFGEMLLYFNDVPDIKHMIDIIDDIDIDEGNMNFWKYEVKRCSSAYKKSIKNYTISQACVIKFSRLFKAPFALLPNGGDKKAFESITDDSIKILKDKYNLYGHYVIGYIGTVFFDHNFIFRVLDKLTNQCPEALLLVVGPIEPKPHPLIIYTGPVQRENIELYYRLMDIGLIPKRIDLDFTKSSFPHKLIEYSMARKFVVSSPLSVFQDMHFPNVRVAALEAESWAKAILELKDAQWHPEWDEIYAKYDWDLVINRVIKDIENAFTPANNGGLARATTTDRKFHD